MSEFIYIYIYIYGKKKHPNVCLHLNRHEHPRRHTDREYPLVKRRKKKKEEKRKKRETISTEKKICHGQLTNYCDLGTLRHTIKS